MNWETWLLWLVIIFIPCYIFVAHLRNYNKLDDENTEDSIDSFGCCLEEGKKETQKL